MTSGKKILRGTGYLMSVPTNKKNNHAEVSVNLTPTFEKIVPFYLVRKGEGKPNAIPNIRVGSTAVIEEELAKGSYFRDERQVADKVIAEHLKHPR